MSMLVLSRRSALVLAGAAAIRPLIAGGGEFWDKKPPSDWSSDEIDRLLTRSPWAKEVTAQYSRGGYTNDTGYPTGTTNPGGPSTYPGGNRGPLGVPGIGTPGIPGIGFPRRGGGQPGGQPRGQGSAFHGTVRWESAQPIRDALKSPLPDVFDGRYVIAVTGIPLLREGESDQEESLDNLKPVTSLQVKGKDYVQPGIVRRQVSSGSVILFGFAKDMLPMGARDSEVQFSTQLTRLIVKARFSPKEMLYHGDVAL